MTNHWPILAATVVVAGTIAVGTYRREELMNAAATPAVVKPLQVQEVQRPPTGAAKPAEASLVATASAAATPPAAASTAPKPKGVGSNPAAVLAELRGALQGALKSAGKASTNATSEAFSMTVDGARVEVLGTTNWSIAIYNENKKAPQTETSSFKAALETVTKTLKLELAQAPTEDAAAPMPCAPCAAPCGSARAVSRALAALDAA